MGELTEQRWGVLSERGCEAIGLAYSDALELVRQLASEKVSGLSIITSDAARRASLTENAPARESQSNGARPRGRE
ncbi:MAG: hypothetical protein QOJ64_1105 [Acidobacteriota bacterium]|jgi:hypothetical protein|nr:hypothetical protein [Acidobacteriota bacterium]